MVALFIDFFKGKVPYGMAVKLGGVYPWQGMALVAWVGGGMVMTSMVLATIKWILKRWGSTSNDLQKVSNRAYYLALMGLLLYGKEAFLWPEVLLWDIFFHLLALLFVVMSLVVVGELIEVIFTVLRRKMQESEWDEVGILQLIKGFVKMGSLLLTLLIVLRLFFHYDLGSSLKGLSIGAGTLTAILALASKDLISNFFGALVVTLSRPFKVGDWIVIGGLEGRVAVIDIRATKLKKKSGAMIYVPNALFVSKHVENYGKGGYLSLTLGVTFPAERTEAPLGFLQGVRKMLDREPHLQGQRSGFELQSKGVCKGDLVLYLYLRSQDEVEQGIHVQGVLSEIAVLALGQGILIH